MKLEIRAGRASGAVAAPPSKSAAHRLLLEAGLCDGVSVVRNVDYSEDILATLDVLRAIGAKVDTDGDFVFVKGTDVRRAACDAPISCRESGSTLRFCIPLLLLSGNAFTLTGQGRLMQRPQSVYETSAAGRGCGLKKAKTRSRCRVRSAPETSPLPETSAASSSAGCCLPFPFWTVTARSA